MDHLPSPIDGKLPHVKAYAVREVYQPGLFFSLPGSAGLDFDSLLANGYDKERPHEPGKKREFLQEWLFFALLAQCLERNILREDFEDKTLKWISTEKLGQFLREWATTQPIGTEPAFEAAKRMRKYRARWALAEARRYVEKHCSTIPVEHDSGDPSSDRRRSRGDTANASEESEDLGVLYLSFAILGETLQRTGVLSEGQEEPWYDVVFDDKTWGYSAHNSKALLENNPCRAEVRRLESTFSGVLATYCASTMKRPDHEKSPSDPIDHAECTAAKCISFDTSKDLTPMHFPRHCNNNQSPPCHKAPFNAELLKDIFRKNQVPLLTFERGELHVQGYDLEKDNVIFCALSHRWKDNILVSKEEYEDRGVKLAYTCQLKALQTTFDEIVPVGESQRGRTPFWVDSLCTTKESTDTMLWSISQTRHIYKKATKVLVWDRGLLMTTKDDHDGDIALNMRIRTSRWAQRLWTLLETVVSKDFAIAFQNGLVSLEKLKTARDKAQQNAGDKYHYVWRLGQPFSPAIEELRSLLPSPTSSRTVQPRYHRIACLWRAVQFRLVSDLKDETIVLANVLNLDAEPLLNVPNESADELESGRMIAFLDMLDSTPGLGIPPGIIFLSGPPPRDVKATGKTGYGWAPKSWLSKRPQHEANPLIQNVFDSFIGKHGLFVTYPGVLLHCSGDPSKLLKKNFHVPLDENLLQWYHVTMESDDDDVSSSNDPDKDAKSIPANGSKSQQSRVEPNVDTFDVSHPSKPQLGLILSNSKYIEIGEKEKLGLLVRYNGKLGRGKALWVSKVGRVWVRLETNRDVVRDSVRNMRDNEHGVFVGEALPEEQLWCVDGHNGDVSR